jgi:hypothetical protein
MKVRGDKETLHGRADAKGQLTASSDVQRLHKGSRHDAKRKSGPNLSLSGVQHAKRLNQRSADKRKGSGNPNV